MLDTLDCSQRGEAMVHVTPFGLMLQAMEKGVESLFFQLYAISRFQTVGTVFVFEAVNHDTGFLDIHILEGSLITAKGLEAGLTVAIQLKLNGLQQKIEPSAFQQQQAEYSDRLNITRPMSTQNYNRKTSFFSEPATPPQKAGTCPCHHTHTHTHTHACTPSLSLSLFCWTDEWKRVFVA